MKTTILKPVFSLAAIAFAVFAAFAFSPAPEKAELVDVWGHNPLEDCDITTVKCVDFDSGQVCRIGTSGTQLYGMSSPTDCNIQLYRKP